MDCFVLHHVGQLLIQISDARKNKQKRKESIHPSQFAKSVAPYFYVQRPPDRIPTAEMVIFFTLLDECGCFNANKTRCFQFTNINN